MGDAVVAALRNLRPATLGESAAHFFKGVVAMKRVGLIGWRGMVGSVLMQRMLEEQDFD
jgi:hypothetical protein